MVVVVLLVAHLVIGVPGVSGQGRTIVFSVRTKPSLQSNLQRSPDDQTQKAQKVENAHLSRITISFLCCGLI